ncbi:spore coat associated protein CotJA [Clostridioides difficile]|uniref:spore coat associated protein CotJA n=1 Tax=Clostridioides difficile TaxID=1496 RepID=UPI001F3B5E35|nr:spore coat associated protein CotJA [Clostridioides difficile]MCM0746079.1 spore coat associated protein CotJA [Clostridioides difficile]
MIEYYTLDRVTYLFTTRRFSSWKIRLEISKKNCGPSLARPYINNQIFTEMYCLSDALKFGTIFPELNLLESEMYNKELYAKPKKYRGGRR